MDATDEPPDPPPPADPMLLAYVEDLRRRLPGLTVPGFDPRDGGSRARVLVLMEKPGPGAARTGIVSRDNPSPTSRALGAFLAEAGLPRAETVIWNVAPAWNGTIKVTGAEVAAGLGHLDRLLPLLPRLDTALLVGARAGRAAGRLGPLRVIASAHPSPQVRAAFPDRWAAIPGLWAGARAAPQRPGPDGDEVGRIEGKQPPLTFW